MSDDLKKTLSGLDPATLQKLAALLSGDDPKTLSGLGKDLNKAATEQFVSFLAMVQSAKQAVRDTGATSGPTVGFPVGELLFDIAKLHTKMIGDLSHFSAEQAELMVKFLGKRRRVREGEPQRPLRLTLASMSAKAGEQTATSSSFQVRNDATSVRGYVIPDVIELVKQGGADEDEKTSLFVMASSSPDPITVQPGCKTSATITLKWTSHPQDGRYVARLPLEAKNEGCPSVELIVELEVPPKPPAGGAQG